MTGRIAVGVSGAGSNLRAIAASAARGELGGEIALVFADRACPALDWAAEQGFETALIPRGDDETLAETLQAVAPDVVALAGYMRIVGPAVLGAFGGRILNTHPSLLPAFPGGHAVDDALAHGARVTGCTVHLVDATLDGGPIVAQEAVDILPGDTSAILRARIQAVEHRLYPRAVALLLAGAIGVDPDGRRVTVDLERADRAVPRPRRALLSVSDKTGLVPFAEGLIRLGFELVSTGGTARALRDAGSPVTDVAAVTGFPEMLDGRVKTLHPRVHGGILADRRLDDHREQLLAAAIAPFELVVVNLYPFGAAAERPGLPLDALIEEIDIGGPSMVRAAAKNHANVAIVTAPARYEHRARAPSNRTGRSVTVSAQRLRSRRSGTRPRTTRGSPRSSRRRMAAAGVALPDEPGLPGASDPYPDSLTITLDKVDALRYGENPHQPAARYRRPGRGPAEGPFATDAPPLQGKPLSYNNVLDASAASALGRALRGPACVVVKHTNPCGAAERSTLLDAWEAAFEGDPVSAFGGVVALTRTVDAATAKALNAIFLEVVVAPGFDTAALDILAAKPNLRLVVAAEIDLTQKRLPARGSGHRHSQLRPRREGDRHPQGLEAGRERDRPTRALAAGRLGRSDRFDLGPPRRAPSTSSPVPMTAASSISASASTSRRRSPMASRSPSCGRCGRPTSPSPTTRGRRSASRR